jgi:hypothetical protein
VASVPNAERWRAQAAQAVAAATRMSDATMSRVLWQIAVGYRTMAEHAERRQSGEPLRPRPGAAYGPEALGAIRDAFDAAWTVLAATAGDDPAQNEAARAELAAAVLSVAAEDAHDPTALRDAALRVLALRYTV